MKKIVFAVATALASLVAHAADNAAATATLTKALSCELPAGKAKAVIKAAKALGAVPGKIPNTYILPAPIAIFGLAVTYITIAPSDGEEPETYASDFIGEKSRLAEIAAAAKLKPLAGDFVGETPKGNLTAKILDRTNVSLGCSPK